MRVQIDPAVFSSPGRHWLEFRRAAGLSRVELADRVGVSLETIRRLERHGPIGRLVRRLAAIELERALDERRVRNPDNEGGTG